MKIIRRTIFLISVALYILSLTQQCYCTERSCADSLPVLIFGIFGIGSRGVVFFVWLANPALWISWFYLFRKEKLTLYTSLFATIFSLSFLFFTEIKDGATEGIHKIINYQPGYWLWVSSACSILIGTLCLRIFSHRVKRK
jgi:hypothetical protein